MLGISDVSVSLAYIVLFLSTVGCIVYGLINWNREGQTCTLDASEGDRPLKDEIELDDDVPGSERT